MRVRLGRGGRLFLGRLYDVVVELLVLAVLFRIGNFLCL